MKYALRKEEIETKKGIKEWQLIYVDEGPGIAPEYRKSVFNKFSSPSLIHFHDCKLSELREDGCVLKALFSQSILEGTTRPSGG